MRPLKNPLAIGFHPVYVPSGASSSTLRTPAISLPSASTFGTSDGSICRTTGGCSATTPDTSAPRKPGPKS